jgi:cyanophycin synthetase
MKKLISNKYANFYLNAAEKLNIKYEIINEKAAFAKIYNDNVTLELSANVLSLNSQLSAAMATNKKKTSLLLKAAGIPTPQFKTFINKIDAERYLLEKLKKGQPMVVKPLSGSLAIGITIKPETPKEIIDAVKEAFDENSMIIIEKYVEGKHYRITVVDDEVIAITERIPAYVVGDSAKTILELVHNKNLEREKLNLPPIILRKKDHNYLKSKKIKVNKVYSNGEKIMLQLGCDLNIGGERKRVDRDKIPQENYDMFVEAAKTLGVRFAGIDYISPDITMPYTKTTSAINEINSAPHSDVHY